jgi:hypothetical protein
MKRILAKPSVALAAGFFLRLFFVFRFPADSGDTALYEQFADNWLRHGVYGMFVDGQLTPVDIRMPGYSAFLAVTYFLSGHSGAAARLWVMLGQVAVDLSTCILIVMLAVLISSETIEDIERLKAKAMWLAATCPFLANYTAVPLTEIWTAFFSAGALLFLVQQVKSTSGVMFFLTPACPRIGPFLARHPFEILGVAGGFLVGLGTLFRPEIPLLMVVSWMVLGVLLLRRRQPWRWIRVVILMAIACLVPLAPWAVRNGVTLHKVQFLTPYYAQLPDETVPSGMIAWEKTWLWRFRDVYLVPWKLEEEPIRLEDIPASAFDTPDEKRRVAATLQEYNETLTLSAEEDAAFAAIARERTARHPVRTYLEIPLARALSIWFTPRIEFLPFSGSIFPLAQCLEDDPLDFAVTIVFFLLNCLYVLLGAWGATRLWRSIRAARPAVALLAGYLFVRTVFLTTLGTPEPRYVVVCIPILLAFAAQVSFRPAKRV